MHFLINQKHVGTSLEKINNEKYNLLRNGVEVEFTDENGENVKK